MRDVSVRGHRRRRWHVAPAMFRRPRAPASIAVGERVANVNALNQLVAVGATGTVVADSWPYPGRGKRLVRVIWVRWDDGKTTGMFSGELARVPPTFREWKERITEAKEQEEAEHRGRQGSGS